MSASLPVLRNRLALEAPGETRDAGGGREIAWTKICHLWASVRAASGREVYEGSRQAQRITHRVIVRSAPFGGAFRPRADQRFTLGGRVFAIRAVFERDGRGRYLTCLCEEGAPV